MLEKEKHMIYQINCLSRDRSGLQNQCYMLGEDLSAKEAIMKELKSKMNELVETSDSLKEDNEMMLQAHFKQEEQLVQLRSDSKMLEETKLKLAVPLPLNM